MGQTWDETQRDAERYRWLRRQETNTEVVPRIEVCFWTASDESCNEGEGLRMDELDATIDKAMRDGVVA